MYLQLWGDLSPSIQGGQGEVKKPTRIPLYPCLSNLSKCASVPAG